LSVAKNRNMAIW